MGRGYGAAQSDRIFERIKPATSQDISTQHRAMTESQPRIAIVCFSRSLGGLELSTLRLVRTMSAKGVFAEAVVPPDSPLSRKAKEWEVRSVTMEPRWRYGDYFAARRLAAILKKNRIDFVILMQSHDIHLASLASQWLPQARLIFYQQMDSRHDKRDLFHTWVFSKLSLWITLTQRMRENALAFTRMPAERMKVVPLGTDLERFDPSLWDKAGARSALGLPPGALIVGVMGRLDPGKGQELVMRALPSLVQSHPNLVYVIAGEETAGESGHKAELERLRMDLLLEDHVRFFPFTDDVPRFMAALDIFLLPSYAETFGLVVIEAMAMGTPVIATDAGGVPEIVTDGKTGLLIEPKSIPAVSSALQRLLDDEGLRRSLGSTAKEEARRRFSMSHCVDEILKLLATIPDKTPS
ncbi:MAG TPA: glycosyltransferase family 4 protein [Bacteroidota bacterium]|nr:glycosyltransferase family 4 protein [Bacteroidota bacterium]